MRWITLLLVLLGLEGIAFVAVYRYVQKEFLKEKTEQIYPKAQKVTLYIFGNNGTIWKIVSKSLLFKPSGLFFYGFKAYGEATRLTAEKAVFLKRNHLLNLYGNVTFLDKTKKVEVFSPTAVINLKKKFFTVRGGVEIRFSNGTVIGQTFYYDYRNGNFKLGSGVNTVIEY